MKIDYILMTVAVSKNTETIRLGAAPARGFGLTALRQLGRVEFLHLWPTLLILHTLLDTPFLTGILYQKHRQPQSAAVQDAILGAVDDIDTPAKIGLWVWNGRRVMIHDNQVVVY